MSATGRSPARRTNWISPADAAKIPDHRGLTLTNDVAVSIDGNALELTRTGSGVSMKIQAKDCANGGVFQMEPARADAAATVFTHVLGNDVFYFDNPNFRDHIGEQCPCVGCNGAVNDVVTVTAPVNFANDCRRSSSAATVRRWRRGSRRRAVQSDPQRDASWHCQSLRRSRSGAWRVAAAWAR